MLRQKACTARRRDDRGGPRDRHPGAQGRGIATEAATAVRDEAFTRLHATRIVARLQPRNHASGRVAARLGMRLHGEAPGRTGELVLVYLLDRPDWQASLAARQLPVRIPRTPRAYH